MTLFKRKPNVKEEVNEEALTIDESTESIFSKNRKNLKDFIVPDYIDFNHDRRYALLGDNTYMKNMYIGTTPDSATFADFLYALYNYGDIDTSIHVIPIDNQVALADLSKTREKLEVEVYDSMNQTNRNDDMRDKESEAAMWRTEVRDGRNKIFEVSVNSTLYENSLRELNNSVDSLKQFMGQKEIGLYSAINQQEIAYRSNKPLNENKLGHWHTFDKRSLACTFPFTSNNVNHRNGVLIGFNLDNNLPVIFDNFDESLDNYNICIFAKSGAGKSTFIKSFSARSATLDKVQTISIDIEPEYIDICETLGGVNIVIGPYSETIINPFHVVPDIVTNKVTGKQEEKVLIEDKINRVCGIIMTMAKGTTGNEEYYNDITKTIIKEAIRKEYERVEITENPESLYVYEKDQVIDGQIVGGKRLKEMPTLSTWYEVIKRASADNETATYQQYYDFLVMVMKDFTKSNKGGFTCFDGQSTVEISYNKPFINFDVSTLNEDTELPLAQHIITDYIWEQLVKRNHMNNGHKLRVIIDEAWRMIGIPEALKFLTKMFLRGRKKNCSTCVISQQFEVFYKEETKAITKNADTKLFLTPDETSVDELEAAFKLTEGETKFLRTCARGKGLLKVNKVSVKLDIEIPPVEMHFIETNQNKKALLRK